MGKTIAIGHGASISATKSSLGSAAFAVLFGLMLLSVAGFAGPIELHNAAHDSRHSFAFPCH